MEGGLGCFCAWMGIRQSAYLYNFSLMHIFTGEISNNQKTLKKITVAQLDFKLLR